CRVADVSFFVLTDPPTTEIYTLSLHDALPISLQGLADDAQWQARRVVEDLALAFQASLLVRAAPPAVADAFIAGRLGEARGNERSEEHTSELQSRGQLVCRRPPEKRKRPYRNA